MNDSERRSVLGDFLRKRRSSLSPKDVGLPAGQRRRTAGLRREEVAQLANIGTSWYMWLEQGRDVRPSVQVLESLATALRLNVNERRHLFFLAGESLPPYLSPDQESIGPSFQRMLDDLAPNPAYILGRRWDFVAWNDAANEVFSISSASPPHEFNLIWRFFTDPVWKGRFKGFDQKAAGMIAEFHTASARYVEDASFAELIEDLKRLSPEFDRLWMQHETPGSLEGFKEVEHPDLGHLEFDHITLQIPNDPDIRVMIYMPLAATRSKLEKYLKKKSPAINKG
ncbi:helix-turn-helix transcriptional regulator [Paenibacillus physcomitrellae]|uniref:Transcriptional regulator n=1 Tax=Paenibacillus physcomitrellae TaxID=1619311 RepID=A0ABQ1FS87_9BACL|nr:helix-turn-helix transcriptional regulator [Paenibacillus physcomitrellae]GGA28350.1 transcriptional regulator [Paenibacillus physcomitrellae]